MFFLLSSSLVFSQSLVTIEQKETYSKIIIDYTTEANSTEVGKSYGEAIKKNFTNFEEDIDQYINNYCELYAQQSTSSSTIQLYNLFLSRIPKIWPRIPEKYRNELQGFASSLSNANNNVLNDGELSKDEIYLLNLLPDIGRLTQCSAISVFGSMSATGENIIGRNLDWYSGKLVKYNSITFSKHRKSNSVARIGYVGTLFTISGFNDKGVFASILDSPTKETFSAENKYAYTYDLRRALEQASSIEDIVSNMTSHDYTFNHNIFLGDIQKSGVLENDLDNNRELRTPDSTLKDGIEWIFNDSVASVNAFLLSGNFENFSSVPSNTIRWEYITQKMSEFTNDGNVDKNEIKNLLTYKGSDGEVGPLNEGDIFNKRTQQSIVFEPVSKNTQIYFRQNATKTEDSPNFQEIDVPDFLAPQISGCVMAPSASFDYAWLFLLIVPAFIIRRKFMKS